MNKRTRVLFKINNEVVVIEQKKLLLDEVERMKWIIASECECQYDDIDVEFEDSVRELSELDVSVEGLIDWKDVNNKVISGINMFTDIDTLLDNLSKGNVDNSIEFV